MKTINWIGFILLYIVSFQVNAQEYKIEYSKDIPENARKKIFPPKNQLHIIAPNEIKSVIFIEANDELKSIMGKWKPNSCYNGCKYFCANLQGIDNLDDCKRKCPRCFLPIRMVRSPNFEKGKTIPFKGDTEVITVINFKEGGYILPTTVNVRTPEATLKITSPKIKNYE